MVCFEQTLAGCPSVEGSEGNAMLTSVECQQRADQKRAEAELHPRNRPRLLTARRSRESARARLADVGARARRRDGSNDTPQVHHAARRRRSNVAARGAGAQQDERTRRIGVLTGYAAGDPEGQTLVGAFRQGLRELGWIECSLGSRGAFLVSRIPKRRSLHARAAARGRYRAGSGQFQ